MACFCRTHIKIFFSKTIRKFINRIQQILYEWISFGIKESEQKFVSNFFRNNEPNIGQILAKKKKKLFKSLFMDQFKKKLDYKLSILYFTYSKKIRTLDSIFLLTPPNSENASLNLSTSPSNKWANDFSFIQ